jgi:hypothetical protein
MQTTLSNVDYPSFRRFATTTTLHTLATQRYEAPEIKCTHAQGRYKRINNYSLHVFNSKLA